MAFPHYDEILARLLPFANPERSAFAAGYTPSRWRILGLAVPQLREEARRLRDEMKPLPLAEAVGSICALAASDIHEIRHLAYELLSMLPKVRRAMSAADLLKIAEGNDNWASVDTWACFVGGPAWREGQFTDEQIHQLAASQNPWERRAALVCSVPLNMKSRGGKGDVPRTVRICAALATDKHPMVAKALSWALRELLEQDTAAAVEFLAMHEVPALVRREVGNKLRTGKKSGK